MSKTHCSAQSLGLGAQTTMVRSNVRNGSVQQLVPARAHSCSVLASRHPSTKSGSRPGSTGSTRPRGKGWAAERVVGQTVAATAHDVHTHVRLLAVAPLCLEDRGGSFGLHK